MQLVVLSHSSRGCAAWHSNLRVYPSICALAIAFRFQFPVVWRAAVMSQHLLTKQPNLGGFHFIVFCFNSFWLKQVQSRNPHFTRIYIFTRRYLKCFFLSVCRSRVSSGSIVSDYGLDGLGSIPGRGKGFFLYPLCPDRLWGPPSLLSNGYRGRVLSPGVKRGRGVTPTTHPI
jgi:hypothetical protein